MVITRYGVEPIRIPACSQMLLPYDAINDCMLWSVANTESDSSYPDNMEDTLELYLNMISVSFRNESKTDSNSYYDVVANNSSVVPNIVSKQLI